MATSLSGIFADTAAFVHTAPGRARLDALGVREYRDGREEIMLSATDNELLTRTGPQAPTGALPAEPT
jgi:hypothetical protein